MNTTRFYFLILTPLVVLAALVVSDRIDSRWFAGLLLFYVLIYRPFTDWQRLKYKGIDLPMVEAFKPWVKYRYIKQLYF